MAESVSVMAMPFITFWCLVLLIGFAVTIRAHRGEFSSVLRYPPLFIACSLFGAAGLAIVSGGSLALIALPLAAGAVFSLVHPVFALAFFIFCVLVRPWEALPGTGVLEVLPRGLAFLCLVSLLFHKIRTRDATLVISKSFKIFLVFALWILAAAFAAFNPSESVAFVVASMIPAVVVMFVVFNSLSNEWCLRTSLSSVLTSVLCIVTVALCDTLMRTSGRLWQERLTGFGQWGNSNDLGALCVVALPVALMRLLERGRGSFPPRITKSLYGCAFLILFCSLWATQSRGALLAFAAALIPLLLRLNVRRFALISCVVVCGIGALVASFALTRDTEDLAGSETSRLNYAIAGFRMIKASPFVGVGPGNYPLLYEQYSSVFVEFGARTAHSAWVLIASESGPIGLILFGALVVIGFRRAWRVRSVRPELVMSFIGYFVAISFLSQTYAVCTYLLIALASSMRQPAEAA